MDTCVNAGILVLEALQHARARGAPVLAEVLGCGSSSDAHHVSTPPADGIGAAHAMRAALHEARRFLGHNTAAEDGLEMVKSVDFAEEAAARVAYVNAHATATPAGDGAELAALRSVRMPAEVMCAGCLVCLVLE